MADRSIPGSSRRSCFFFTYFLMHFTLHIRHKKAWSLDVFVDISKQKLLSLAVPLSGLKILPKAVWRKYFENLAQSRTRAGPKWVHLASPPHKYVVHEKEKFKGSYMYLLVDLNTRYNNEHCSLSRKRQTLLGFFNPSKLYFLGKLAYLLHASFCATWILLTLRLIFFSRTLSVNTKCSASPTFKWGGVMSYLTPSLQIWVVTYLCKYKPSHIWSGKFPSLQYLWLRFWKVQW